MKIIHQESGAVYEINERKGSYVLTDSVTHRSYQFRESYEALWHAIELTRNASFESLSEEDLTEAAKRSHISLVPIPKSLTASLRKEKISRTYYDQILLKLLSHYRIGTESITISNKTNFVVYHELTHLLRSMFGTKHAVPSLQV